MFEVEYDLLEELLRGNKKLAVVGLGYVGLPLAYEFSKHISVIGFDVNQEKIANYLKGIDPTMEVGYNKLSNCNIEFTSDENKLKEADFIIVAVPTPVDTNHKPDLTDLIQASRIVGRNIHYGTFIVYESTVYPGATRNICLPEIEKQSGLKCGRDFAIGYSPERINPGDKVHTLTTIKKVVSAIDEDSLKIISDVYSIIIEKGIHKAKNIETAEAIKVIENTQRDVNIAFMNEVAVILDKMNIDTAEVLEGMNTKWNALNFRPGLVGGHCLDVDPYYLIEEANRLGCNADLMNTSRLINDRMSHHVAYITLEKLRKHHNSLRDTSVIILGTTFKENCPDIRNSKIFDIYQELKNYGINPIVTDEWADKDEVYRKFGIQLVDYEKLPKADCVIVAVGHKKYRNLKIADLKKMYKDNLSNKDMILIDVKSLYDLEELENGGMDFYRL